MQNINSADDVENLIAKLNQDKLILKEKMSNLFDEVIHDIGPLSTLLFKPRKNCGAAEEVNSVFENSNKVKFPAASISYAITKFILDRLF